MASSLEQSLIRQSVCFIQSLHGSCSHLRMLEDKITEIGGADKNSERGLSWKLINEGLDAN